MTSNAFVKKFTAQHTSYFGAGLQSWKTPYKATTKDNKTLQIAMSLAERLNRHEQSLN